MTALAGVWRFGATGGHEASCVAMLEAQAIYGPDARDVRDLGEIALGRNLYHLLPEDAHDRQPVGEGATVLVADARLDNRETLCAALGIGPDAAGRMADSTLILRAWERWGEAVFDHLLGDYAFAVWDGARRRLVLARDPLGGRPLVWHRGPGVFAFASMPSGLHALDAVARAPDEGFVAEFLALLPETGSRTFFRDLSRVEPAHLLIVTEDGQTARRHWDPLGIPPWDGGDPVEAARREFDRAVAVRLRGASGRVGAHLSGGLDSGGVAATAAGLLAVEGERLTAYTSAPHPGFIAPPLTTVFADETAHAAATAALWPNIDHVVIAAPVGGLVDDLDRNLDAYQRPFRNPVNVCWWNAINEDARRRGLKIMLTGEMGNISLSFAGNGYLAECVTAGRWRTLWRAMRDWRARGSTWRHILITAFGSRAPDVLWSAAHRLRGKTADLARHSTIRPDTAAALDMDARARAVGHDFMYRPPKGGLAGRVSMFGLADPGAYRKGALGLHGIDQRDPTSDRRLVELCLSLPTEVYFGGGEGRVLARRVFAGRLPDLVLHERRKGTQGADRRDRLVAASGAISTLLTELRSSPSASRIVDLDRLQQMVEEPYEGDPSTAAAEDHALFRGLVTARFLQRAEAGTAR